MTQTSPIIIYAYTTLTVVALYGNYMLIIMGIQTLMTAMFNSMNAGIGNLVAGGDRKRILLVFEELFSVRFLFTCTMCFGVFMLAPSFVTLWIGSEYVMDTLTLLLMTAILFIQLSRTTVDAYINAYGLFGDIWAPVVEASINVGLSILLGYFFGLHGILLGVLISLFLVIFCWKPWLLFRKGLKQPVFSYIYMYVKHLLVAIISSFFFYYISKCLPFNPKGGIFSFFFYGLFIIISFILSLALILYYTEQGMRSFVRRVRRIV